MTQPLSPRAQAIRELMATYIGERLAHKTARETKKLEQVEASIAALQASEEPDSPALNQALEQKLQIEAAIEKEAENHVHEAWLHGAMRRVTSIQAVTHLAKADDVHAHIRNVSSLYIEPQQVAGENLLTSQVLGPDFPRDVTGNAAALDVNRFLNLVFEGLPLQDWLWNRDPDAMAALSSDPTTALTWTQAFDVLRQSRTGGPASSSLMRQLYWCTDDAGDPREDSNYRILAPLYPTHLSHVLYQKIQDSRFGEMAKKAREARRANRASPYTFDDYPELAFRKIGGSNPQNISQLNSAQRGVCLMLSSLPPRWETKGTRPLFGTPSLFRYFGRRYATQEHVEVLRKILLNPQPTNIRIRDAIKKRIDALVEELVAFSRPFQLLEEPWSAHERCHLPNEERLWLNPWRALDDEAFYTAFRHTDWQEQLGSRFASWLNSALKIPVGDSEHRHWHDNFLNTFSWRTLLTDDEPWEAQIEKARTAQPEVPS